MSSGALLLCPLAVTDFFLLPAQPESEQCSPHVFTSRMFCLPTGPEPMEPQTMAWNLSNHGLE